MKNKLARQIGFEVVTIVVGAAVIRAAYRAFEGNAESAWTLFQYCWITGALGVFLYLFLLLRVRRRIIRPLREFSDHTEDMSMGIFQKWEYPDFHSELDPLAATMNSVADYNDKLQVSWRALSFAIAPHMANLRNCEDLPENLRADLEETWDHLRRMDASIMGVFSPSPHFSRPRTIPDKRTTLIYPEAEWSPNRPWEGTKQKGLQQIPTDLMMADVLAKSSGLPEACA